MIETKTQLIGVESKRFEPYRARKPGEFSPAYRRDVWGSKMRAFETMRDDLTQNPARFAHLDAVQLVKHAFGIRTQAHKRRLNGILVYLYAEPTRWPKKNGRPISAAIRREHADEAKKFANTVAGSEVAVLTCTYREFLAAMRSSPFSDVRVHAEAVKKRFNP